MRKRLSGIFSGWKLTSYEPNSQEEVSLREQDSINHQSKSKTEHHTAHLAPKEKQEENEHKHEHQHRRHHAPRTEATKKRKKDKTRHRKKKESDLATLKPPEEIKDYKRWSIAIENRIKSLLDCFHSFLIRWHNPHSTLSTIKAYYIQTAIALRSGFKVDNLGSPGVSIVLSMDLLIAEQVILFLSMDFYDKTMLEFPLNKSVSNVRSLLLRLWSYALELLKIYTTLEKQRSSLTEDSEELSYPINAEEANTFFKLIPLIMTRHEFDCRHRGLDEEHRTLPIDTDLLLAIQYRKLLYETQIYVVERLLEISNEPEYSNNLVDLPEDPPGDQYNMKSSVVLFAAGNNADKSITTENLSPSDEGLSEKKKTRISEQGEADNDVITTNDMSLECPKVPSVDVYSEKPVNEDLSRVSERQEEIQSPKLKAVSSEWFNMRSSSFSFYHSLHLHIFCTQVLAINFFRIPDLVGDNIVRAFSLNRTQTREYFSIFNDQNSDAEQRRSSVGSSKNDDNELSSKKDCESDHTETPDPQKEQSTQETTGIEDYFSTGCRKPLFMMETIGNITGEIKMDSEYSSCKWKPKEHDVFQMTQQMKKLFPNLFQWNDYHSALNASSNEIEISEYAKFRDALKETSWISSMKNHPTMFYSFFHQWILHVHSIIQDNIVDWNFLFGYTVFSRVFLLDMKNSGMPFSRVLLDTSSVFLLTDSTIINTYIRFIFLRTNVCQLFDVTDCLNTITHWFSFLFNEGLYLDDSFDIDFFLKGLNIILERDHHHLVYNVLELLYNFSELFLGVSRKKLFSDFLLETYFYDLFLHWDRNVRNTFHQLLVFKFIRTKRSFLHQEGIRVPELSSKDLQNDTGKESSVPDKKIDDPESIETTLDVPKDMEETRSSSMCSRKRSESEENEQQLDSYLLLKINEMQNNVENQIRQPENRFYEKALEVYAPQALSEYKVYLSRYFEWERSGNLELPNLLPLCVLRSYT